MKRGHSWDVVLTMVLFGVFAGSVLLVLMLGAKSYQSVSASMKESYEERTCLQYIATKMGHYSGENAVSVVEFGDGSALALREDIEGCAYVTYLYLYDGYAMELFCEEDLNLAPDAGFYIMEVGDLAFAQVTDALVRLTCTGSGGTAQLYVGLHLGEGDLA